MLAHQFTSQLNRKVAAAIFGNVYTMTVFRVGVDDAAYLQKAFPVLTADDLQNLAIGETVTRCGRAEDSFFLKTRNYPAKPETNVVSEIRKYSQEHYSIPTAEALKREAAEYKPPSTSSPEEDEELFGRA